MIYPTTADILRCVDQTLLTASADDMSHMSRMAVRSALATSRHMIRHANLRAQLERSILLDDIAKTGALLEKVLAYFEPLPIDNANGIKDIGAALDAPASLLTSAADEMETIIARAMRLRELVYVSLAQLQKFSPADRETEAYREMRRLMRDYMTYQIRQEAKFIYPAFAGQGPRR